jgi:hypothetical protein
VPLDSSRSAENCESVRKGCCAQIGAGNPHEKIMHATRLRAIRFTRPPVQGRKGYGSILTGARRTHIQATLLWGLLFGSIGTGYVIYGHKQRAPIPLIVGVCLMVFPYLVPNVYLLVGIGIALCVVPYFFRE